MYCPFPLPSHLVFFLFGYRGTGFLGRAGNSWFLNVRNEILKWCLSNHRSSRHASSELGIGRTGMKYLLVGSEANQIYFLLYMWKGKKFSLEIQCRRVVRGGCKLGRRVTSLVLGKGSQLFEGVTQCLQEHLVVNELGKEVSTAALNLGLGSGPGNNKECTCQQAL